jgi:hypothetical protein
MVMGLTRDAMVSGRVDRDDCKVDSQFDFLHRAFRDGDAVQPSIAWNGMITMRLHRLHFNSRALLLTFAINWPHSQRVSATSDVA